MMSQEDFDKKHKKTISYFTMKFEVGLLENNCQDYMSSVEREFSNWDMEAESYQQKIREEYNNQK